MRAASASRQKQRRLCFSNSQGALALTSHILVAKRKENEKRLTVGYHILIQKFPFCMQLLTRSYDFIRELPGEALVNISN